MKQLEYHKISKSDFLKLNEDDLMFITNPGRMGDEDGSTFVIKKGKVLTIYRLDGWMYPKAGEIVEISLNDALKQFPKWLEEGKYKYFYMGFGNGLSVDQSISKEYEPYLNHLVENYIKDKTEEEKESLQYAAIYNVWEDALIQMANEKGYTLK